MVGARLPQSKPASAPAPAVTPPPRRAAQPMRLLRPLVAAAPTVRLNPMSGGGARSAMPAPVAQIVSSPDSGEALPQPIRRTLEHSFDADLSGVRVHSDPKAADSIGARAFTYGLHIYLGKGEKSTDLALMAHEVTHVVQQQGAPVLQLYSEAGTDRFEHEAERVSAVAQRGGRTAVHERTGGVKVQKQGLMEGGEAWMRDQVLSLLEEGAPELAPILRRGVVEWLKEKLGNAVQAMMDEMARPVRTLGDLVSGVRRHFASLVGWLGDAGAKIARGDCSSISEAADKIHQVFDALSAPVVERVKHYANIAKQFFQGLWDRFGAPVWDLLRRIGGAVWEQIQRVGRWVWEKTQPIRDWLTRAWTWFKNWLGIGEGEEGQNGILQWFQRKASEAWEWVSARIAPYKRQILIMVGILALLSPAGPLIAMVAVQAGILRGIQWLRQNMRNRGSVVQGRTVLRGVILPAILGAIDLVSGVARSIANAITGALTRVVSTLSEMAATVGSIPILSFASGLVNFLVSGYRGLLEWAMEGVQGLASGLQTSLQRLGGFARMLVDFLERVGTVVSNVSRLASALGRRVWNIIPACIRDPFIDFFIPLILRQIPFFSELAATPEAWQQTRAQVMNLIRQVFTDFDLMGAMRSVFRLIVRVLRIPIDLAAQVLAKGAQAFDLVVAAPLRFIENVLKAVLRGMGLFMRNFLSHLWYGIQGWLLNAVETSGTGIRPPASWDLRGIFGFVLNVLGVSLDRVLDLLARRIGRPMVDRIRRVVNVLTGAWEWVKVAINEGPAGLWRMVADRLGNLAQMVLESAVGWVMTRIIAIVSVRLAALAGSAGWSAILEAIVAVYQAVQTAIEYARRILEIMLTVFNTVGQIATGVIDPAAQGVERGLRMVMPIVIGFLANYAGLRGIGGRLREIIMGVRERVDNAILGLIDRALAAGRAILDRIQAGVAAVVGWWRTRFGFTTDDGTPHSVYYEGSDARSARLTVASTPVPIDTFLNDATTRINAMKDSTDKQNQLEAIRDARAFVQQLDRITYRTGGTPPANVTIEERAVNGLLRGLSEKLKILMRAAPGSEAPVPHITVIPGFSSTKASALQVKHLYKDPANHENGTSADSYTGTLSGAWTLTTQWGVKRSDWVAFHIFNDNLGGKAVDSNLVPIPKGINNHYKETFEKSMKVSYDAMKIVWMNASFHYRTSEGLPEFLLDFAATGGEMKYVPNKRIWEPDTSKNFVPYSAPDIPLPQNPSIPINLLPVGTSPLDVRARGLAVAGTPLTVATLELIMRYRRNYGMAVVGKKGDLLAYYERAVAEFEPDRSAIKRRNDQQGLDNARIDYRVI